MEQAQTVEGFSKSKPVENEFRIQPLHIQAEPQNEQIGFFHSTFDKLHVCVVTMPREDSPSSDTSM
ncbi:MAG: hypothetical protein Q9193_003207, partial [Seirophora villosa]